MPTKAVIISAASTRTTPRRSRSNAKVLRIMGCPASLEGIVCKITAWSSNLSFTAHHRRCCYLAAVETLHTTDPSYGVELKRYLDPYLRSGGHRPQIATG